MGSSPTAPLGAARPLALVSVLVGVLAWRSATAVGVIGLGPVQISVGLHAARFFPFSAARLARRLRTAAGTDPLTRIANRRAWEEQAARHLARAARSGEPLSFAILDLDDFKEVNDRNGHSAGDDLLRELTAAWSRRLRKADLLGRYGGDEFVLCCRRPTTTAHVR